MLCEDCHEREATVHLTQITGNKKSVLNLCPECAEKRGFSNPLKSIPFPLGDFLSSMVEKVYPGGSEAMEKLVCTGCGLRFSEFAKSGRLGCGKCYETFHTQIDDLLRKIHGSARHAGKLPSGSPEKMEPLKEERRLQEALRRAVQAENFEEAAEIRDRLKEIASDKH
jgi:protein arginine kinase activator